MTRKPPKSTASHKHTVREHPAREHPVRGASHRKPSATSARSAAPAAKSAEAHRTDSHRKSASAKGHAGAHHASAQPHSTHSDAAHGKAGTVAKATARAATATAAHSGPEPRRASMLPEDRQSQLKLLIARGKEQGYLTYAQVNDHLPPEIVDPEQIEGIVNTINDMGIPVYEKAPDTESLLASEPSSPAEDEALEEAAAALAALDAELGRTTDPVRMYMREMGTVELLTREGEIRIAKRIEEGLDAVRRALAKYPATFEHLLRTYELIKVGQARLIDMVVGFIDPNAPDVIAQPQNPTKPVELEADAEDKEEDAEEADESRRGGDRYSVPDPEEVARRMGSIAKETAPARARLRSPSMALRIPRPRRCARSWRASSWSSSCHRACSTR